MMLKHGLGRNVAWNILGAVLPLLMAVIAIPRVIAIAGAERFGLLAIIWMLIGYFSLFDLGLGRALTKLVAERLETKQDETIPSLVRTALVVICCLSVLASISVGLAAPAIVTELLNVPTELREEAVESIRILSAGLPFVILSTAFVGILEAYQKFGTINAVRAPMGVLSFGIPWMALSLVPELQLTTALLALVRVVSCLAFAVQCARIESAPLSKGCVSRLMLQPLLSFGGWLTLSNTLGPLMVYFDRFVIGALLGLAYVSYYVTPYEVVTRLWILPVAIIDVLFPALTMAYVGDARRLRAMFRTAIKFISLIMLVPSGIIVLLAPELLDIWLGSSFQPVSAEVARWLALGVFTNSIARVPAVLLLGSGKPDWVAKTHLCELVPYGILLFFLTINFGLVGAAIAWTLRVFVDTSVLFWLCTKRVPALGQDARAVAIFVATTSVTLWLISLVPSAVIRISAALLVSITALGAIFLELRLKLGAGVTQLAVHAETTSQKEIP